MSQSQFQPPAVWSQHGLRIPLVQAFAEPCMSGVEAGRSDTAVDGIKKFDWFSVSIPKDFFLLL